MNTQSDDERTLRQLITDWSAAVRKRDYEGALAHHAPSILMFDVPPPFQSEGLAAYRKTWDLFFSTMADPPTFDFSDVRLTVGTDLAFATAHGKCLYKERETAQSLISIFG
jgi:ketosteroid isomerase-like protein